MVSKSLPTTLSWQEMFRVGLGHKTAHEVKDKLQMEIEKICKSQTEQEVSNINRASNFLFQDICAAPEYSTFFSFHCIRNYR